mmetsp:Transcript_11846/g.31264  ORF Transcript_11846/g.31264 Transcript_11846/m.31264 type:complete len:213 (+) Transcript_11846:72-710(+)
MANPAARQVSVNHVTPLYTKGHVDGHSDPRKARDIQVYPQHLRETDTHQTLHRTAGVKHYLRDMATRSDMLSTYEHDFGFMTRPKPFDTGADRADRSLRGSFPEAPKTPSVRSSASSMRSRSSCTKREGSGMHGATQRDPSATIGISTNAKLRAAAASGAPMKLAVTGWGDSQWSPKTHPHMINGMASKRVSLMQTTNIMNLRAPDVPFSTR